MTAFFVINLAGGRSCQSAHLNTVLAGGMAAVNTLPRLITIRGISSQHVRRCAALKTTPTGHTAELDFYCQDANNLYKF